MPTGIYEDHDNLTNKLMPFIFNQYHMEQFSDFTAHWHKNIELLYCLSGKGKVLIMGEPYRFYPGCVIAVNPNEIHMITTDEGVNYSCLIVTDDFCTENGIELPKKRLQVQIDSPQLQAIFDKVNKDFADKGNINITRTRLDTLHLIYELYENHSQPHPENIIKYDEITTVIRYIYDNYSHDISLDDAAAVAGLSKYYFIKKFKKITGTTFVMFLNKIRCNNAAEMISNGVPVNEAGYACGFKDPAFFSRMFKQLLGKTPSSIKKQKMKENKHE